MQEIAISETQILKISWGMPPTPIANCATRLTRSHLRCSHTIVGGGQGKWALLQFCPTTEESLKNALSPSITKTDFSKSFKVLLEWLKITLSGSMVVPFVDSAPNYRRNNFLS